MLTGGAPYVVNPRLTAAPGQPVLFGTTIVPQELPVAYTMGGQPVFASGSSKLVPGNTVMDVLRYEQDLAALSPDHQITPLSTAGPLCSWSCPAAFRWGLPSAASSRRGLFR